MIERREYRPNRAPANRKHFTEQNVLTLRCKSKQYLTWDEGTGAAKGLAILVSPKGAKSYRVVFYYPGSSKPQWMHLGRVGEMALAAARERARAVRGAASRGEDPTAGEAAKSDSFATAVESYIQNEQVGRHGNTSAQKTKRVILLNCEEWLKRPVATLRYAEIENLLSLIRDGNADNKPRPYLANRLYSHLKDFFSWCVRRHTVGASPMADMERPWTGEKPRSREWFKGDAADKAIIALWKAADEIGGDEGRYLKMLLLTGKRKSGLAAMRWEDIDANWYWHAPPSQAKNKRLHPIPLPKKAQQILHPRGQRGLVFGPLKLNHAQYAIKQAAGMPDFFWHGVRHLLETKLAELKVPPHIRDQLFDHAASRGAGKGYDHHGYKDEMLAALDDWAAYVERLVSPGEGVARLR